MQIAFMENPYNDKLFMAYQESACLESGSNGKEIWYCDLFNGWFGFNPSAGSDEDEGPFDFPSFVEAWEYLNHV